MATTLKRRQVLKNGVSYVIPGRKGIVVFRGPMFKDGFASAPETLDVSFDGFVEADAEAAAKSEQRAAKKAEREAKSTERLQKQLAAAEKRAAQAEKAAKKLEELKAKMAAKGVKTDAPATDAPATDAPAAQ